MLIQTLTAIPLLVAGVFMIWWGYRFQKGAIPRNHWLGIRNSYTLESDNHWIAGHKAAAKYFFGGGIGLIVSGIAALIIPEQHSMIPALIGAFWILGAMGLGSGAAKRQTQHVESKNKNRHLS